LRRGLGITFIFSLSG